MSLLTAEAPNVLPLKIDKKTCSKSEPQKKGGENVKDCQGDNVYNHIFEKKQVICFTLSYTIMFRLGFV